QVSLAGLLVISAIENKRRDGVGLMDALVDGPVSRFRALVMAALLAILGLLPMALSHAVGSETQRPFAVVIIGGMFTTLAVALADPPAEVTADQAIALYREHSPRRVAVHAQIDVTAADVVEAHIYPNPTLGIAHTHNVHGDTAGPGQQYGVDVQIPLLLGN